MTNKYCFCNTKEPFETVSLFNSQKWSTWNFSPLYPYIILQTGNENIQTNQVDVVILIQYQVLMANL